MTRSLCDSRAWLLVASFAACTPSTEPPVEVPVQPLVIGTSPSAQVAAAPDTIRDAPVATAPSSPLAIPARDPRLVRPARPSPLVVTETHGLESLFAVTSVGSPDRGSLARRLAEDYAELGRTLSGSSANEAHQKALSYYELVTTEAPQHPNVDEAYYYAGLEHEIAGDLRSARKSYYELIVHAPNSKLIPLAYFAFGENFYAEAVDDPSKNDLAVQAYLEALKYPPPGNVIFADTLFRLGEVYDRKGETAKASAMFARLQRDFPTSEAATRAHAGAARATSPSLPIRRP